MKKLLLASILITSLLTGCGNGNGIVSEIDWSKEGMKELLKDNAFENGFNLLTTSTNNGRTIAKVLDYDKQAKGEPYWEMAQWWTPFDFKDGVFTKLDNDKFEYKNESRCLTVDTKSNSLRMDLNSWKEYQYLFGHSRTGNENWSHFLIEQNLREPVKLKNLKHLYVHLDFNLHKSVDLDPGQPIPCAQITWYFTITDVKNGDPRYESGNNDYFWFGLPMYDSRYENISGYKHVDSGFVGATNKLIYCLDSNQVIKNKIEIGKDNQIEMDILPFIKQAYIYGINNDAMQNSSWEDLYLNYMNLGWELPGSFDVSITLKNIKIAAEEK